MDGIKYIEVALVRSPVRHGRPGDVLRLLLQGRDGVRVSVDACRDRGVIGQASVTAS